MNTNKHQRNLSRKLMLAVALFGLGVMLIPLTQLFSAGKDVHPGSIADTLTLWPENVGSDERHLVTVTFHSHIESANSWHFSPAVSQMEVRPGELYTTRYRVRNPTRLPMVVRVVPQVTPGFKLTLRQNADCFCFAGQLFAAGEERLLPLQFMIDPDIPIEIDTLRLTYVLQARKVEDTPLMLVDNGQVHPPGMPDMEPQTL